MKQFGQRMVDDHTAVNGRLQKLAQAKGLNLPTTLDKKHQDKIDSLSKKTGPEFDKAYIDEMVDDHKRDVDAFDKASKDAKDASVKEFAGTTLPTLREHLQQAQGIRTNSSREVIEVLERPYRGLDRGHRLRRATSRSPSPSLSLTSPGHAPLRACRRRHRPSRPALC